MDKRDRVKAAIRKEPVDRVPASFSLHFPRDKAFGDAAVKAHLDFYRDTDVDILKIMNENLVPLIGEFSSASDWKKVPAYNRRSRFITEQLDLVKRLRDAEPDAYVLTTVHGVCASTIHTLEANYGYEPVRRIFAGQMRSDPQQFIDARARISDAMCELAAACIELGCDGVYYAALGGESRFYTDGEFDIAVKPFDLKILSAVREAGGDVFLHICKDGLNMERYRDYGAYSDVVNWGVYEAPFSLEDGRAMFPDAAIMGGLRNRSGVLVDGTEEEIAREVRKVISGFGKTGFILGADCTLPTDIEPWRIRAAVKAAY